MDRLPPRPVAPRFPTLPVIAPKPPPLTSKVETALGAFARQQQLDGFDRERNRLPHLPGLDAEGLKAFMEKVAYSRSLDHMSDAELQEEAARQAERLDEATTGHAQDPEVAAEATWKLAQVRAELQRRQLQDSTLPLDKYTALLGGLTDTQLRSEAQRLKTAIADARTGPHTNETDAQTLEAKLAAVKSEQAQRTIDDPDTSLLHVMVAARNLSDPALTADEAKLRAEYDATVKALENGPPSAVRLTRALEKIAARLNILDAEMKRRGLSPAPQSTEPAPPTSDGTGGPDGTAGALGEAGAAASAAASAVSEAASAAASAAAPETQPYTVVPGDTLGDLAWKISQEHGGTPDAQTVLADLIRINCIANPDLIEVGQVLQVPTYTN